MCRRGLTARPPRRSQGHAARPATAAGRRGLLQRLAPHRRGARRPRQTRSRSGLLLRCYAARPFRARSATMGPCSRAVTSRNDLDRGPRAGFRQHHPMASSPLHPAIREVPGAKRFRGLMHRPPATAVLLAACPHLVACCMAAAVGTPWPGPRAGSEDAKRTSAKRSLPAESPRVPPLDPYGFRVRASSSRVRVYDRAGRSVRGPPEHVRPRPVCSGKADEGAANILLTAGAQPEPPQGPCETSSACARPIDDCLFGKA